MGLLGLLKNLVLLAKNAPKIPGIISQLASPNFIENVASIMVEQEMADELKKIDESQDIAIAQVREKYAGKISDEEMDERISEIEADTFDREAFMEQAVKQKKQQIDPPISTALAPVTAAFGVPIFLTRLVDFLSAGGKPQPGLNVRVDSNPNDPAMEADVGVATTPPYTPPVETSSTGKSDTITKPEFGI